MDRFTIYAGPAQKYGPEHIYRAVNFPGGATVEMEFGTIASAPSAGEVNLKYFDRRMGHQDCHVVIPGKTTICVGDCLCPVFMRAKSYSTGQAYEVTVRSWRTR